MRDAAEHITVVQDAEQALAVIQDAGAWLQETGKNRSQWWEPKHLTERFLSRYAKLSEFYVALVDGMPAAAAIIQPTQTAQDWSSVDGNAMPPALYVHWLAVHRNFRGRNLPQIMLEFAEQLARQQGLKMLRLDTQADEAKLRHLYESLGFRVVKVVERDGSRTALLEKPV